MESTLSADEIERLSGGYTRPAEQLRELLKLGYWRARRSKLNGKVILERPHFEAVSRGQDTAPTEQSAPKLRKPARRNLMPA